MNKKQIMRNRLKAVLFGLREKYPALIQDIDKIVPFLAFERDLTAHQLADLLTKYPVRLSADYDLVVIRYIQQAVQAYHYYVTIDKGFRKTNAHIRLLEQILRDGFDAYKLVYDEVRGYDMEKK